jgi:hypothetical protein
VNIFAKTQGASVAMIFRIGVACVLLAASVQLSTNHSTHPPGDNATKLTTTPAGPFTNGSFDSDLAGWTRVGNAEVVSGSFWVATQGVKLVAFNAGNSTPNGVLSQNFATTAGRTYTLAFDAGAISGMNRSEQRLEVTVLGQGRTLLSQTVSLFAPGDGARYVPMRFTFVADSGTTRLIFRDVSRVTTNLDLLLDNVRLTAQSGAPVIITEPQNATVSAGSSARFDLMATGQEPLSYQWRFNDTPIAGATSSTYNIAHVQASHAGNYDVVVSNSAGSVTRRAATLTVTGAGAFTNGGFETDFAGWTQTGSVQVVSGSFWVATEGVRVAAFNAGNSKPNGTLSQSFATTAGRTYTLEFDVGAISSMNRNEQRLQVIVQGQGSALLSETVSVFATGNGARYEPLRFSFEADSSTTTLTFKDVSFVTANLDLLLDNVRVTQSGPATVTSEDFRPDGRGKGLDYGR